MRKKSLALTLMLAFSCLLGGKLMGQSIVTIGTSTSTNTYTPIQTTQTYSYSQQIYKATEINGTGTIKSIAFYGTANGCTRSLDIYLINTTKETFSSTSDWISVSDSDKVYSGSVTFSNNSWTTVTVSDFTYTGNNLALIVHDKTNNTESSAISFRVNSYSNSLLYKFGDDASSPITAPTTGTRAGSRNNIQLSIAYDYPEPTELTVSDITNESASIAWTDCTATTGNTFSRYEYQLRTTGVYGSLTTTPNPCELSGLEAGTMYTIRVRAVYTDGASTEHTSKWVETSFTTDCNDLDVSLASWNFDDKNTLPDCWRIKEFSGDYPRISTNNSNSSSNCLQFYNTGNQVVLIPAIDGGLNGKTLNFYAKKSSTTGTYTITVGYYNSLGVFTTIENNFSILTTYQSFDVEFDGLPNDVKKVAIKGSTDGNYHFLYIDDVSIVAPVGCAPVTSPTVGTVTYNSAQLSWTAGGSETNWKLQYRASGAGSWTTVDVSSANLVAGIYTLYGLSENTTYEWQVAAWCDTSDDDNISSYEAGDDFTTPAEFPAPTGLTVDNITTTSARLSWTAGSVEQDHWDIYYSTNSTAPTVSPDSYISNTTTKPYTITSLTAGKTYYVWVRGNYNNGEHYSVWSEVKSFRVPVSLPYSYDFEDETEMDYWTINGGSSNTGRYNGNGYLSSEYSFRFFYGFDAGTQYLITPELNNTTHGVHVEFYAYRSSSSSSNQSTLNVSYSTEDSNSFDWDDEDAFIPTYNSYTLYKFDFPAGTKYIAIKYVASTYDHIYIDNISFRAPDNTFTTAGNWNTPAYWSYGALPTASDNVTINAACTIPNDCTAQANNITLGSGGSLTIADGGQLICNNSVTAKFQKHIEHYTVAAGKDHYYLIANPTTGAIDPEDVAGMVVDSDVESKDYDLYYFDEAQSGAEWRNYREAPFNLENGKGYLYAKSSDITLEFSGTVLPGTTANITLSKSGSGTYNGFNLVGNPLSNNVTSMKIGESSCSYYKVNSSTGVFAASEADIIVGEAFMVEAPSDEATLTLNPSAKDEAGFTNEVIRLEVSNSKFTDVAYVYFGNHLPLTKINHLNDEAPMLYIHNENSDKAVEVYNNRGEVKSINVNFEAKTIGTYTISAKMVKGEIKYMHLYDRFTGIDTDLLIDDYSFIGANEDQPGRFILKLEAIDNEFEGSDNFAYQSGNNIMVNGEGELQIFDVMGRMVMNERINGVESISGLSRGIYIFRVIGETQKTQKIVVR